MSKQQGIEQGRAAYAYKCVENAVENGKVTESDYKAYTRNIPMMIKTNGLGAALAFVKAKGSSNAAYKLLYEQIYEWLKSPEGDKLGIFKNTKKDLIAVVIEQDSQKYRFSTLETLALLAWMKRFAEGLIDK